VNAAFISALAFEWDPLGTSLRVLCGVCGHITVICLGTQTSGQFWLVMFHIVDMSSETGPQRARVHAIVWCRVAIFIFREILGRYRAATRSNSNFCCHWLALYSVPTGITAL
jgi:hypothetical protein